jgi:Bacterial Ig domain
MLRRIARLGLVGSLALLSVNHVAAQPQKPVTPPLPAAPPRPAPPPVAQGLTNPSPPAGGTLGATPPAVAPLNTVVSPIPAPAAPPSLAAPVATSGVPKFVKLLPTRYDRDEIVIAVDQELRLAVVVEHPDGSALEMRALGLPQRAHFDPQLRAVTWRPTEAEIGSYQVRFLASDGTHEASRTLLISVTENRPPTVGSLWFEVPASQPANWFIDAADPEGAPLSFSAEGLPKGAILKEHTGQISFVPEPDQVGEYPIVVHVSDGQKVNTQRGTIAVRSTPRTPSDHDDWTSFLLPGVGYSIYSPRDPETTVFHGLNLELVVAAWIHRNDNRGPSHGRIYLNAELLNATGLHIPLMFAYSAGLSLSFERNPTRNWLIPHYGVEVGGIIHDRFGAFFQTTPYAGVHLYSSPNVFLGARLGYRLVPSRVDDLAGIHFGLVSDISIW